ncbi:MAG: hypothetical protein ACTINM_06635, partial [Acetobacter cibinongensis]
MPRLPLVSLYPLPPRRFLSLAVVCTALGGGTSLAAPVAPPTTADTQKNEDKNAQRARNKEVITVTATGRSTACRQLSRMMIEANCTA